MAIKVPKGFNYKNIALDTLEMEVRDMLKINIENWAKFRHRIKVGVSSTELHSIATISEAVKCCYLELGKSHYEAVTMLGATKMSKISVLKAIGKNPLIFKKSFKEFYMHAGSVIDNLARLIYIINIPVAPTQQGQFGLKRHSIGYGGLRSLLNQNPNHLTGYVKFIKNKEINEIKTVRNNFTHSWPPTIFQINGVPYWPTAMRKREQYYLWPHDITEAKKIKIQYRKKLPIIEMIKEDWQSLEVFQNAVFGRLSKDIEKFEVNHSLTIN